MEYRFVFALLFAVLACVVRANQADSEERELLETLREVLRERILPSSDADVTDVDGRGYEGSNVDVDDQRALDDEARGYLSGYEDEDVEENLIARLLAYKSAVRQRGLPYDRQGKRGWTNWFKEAFEDAGDWFKGAGNSIADFFTGAYKDIAQAVNTLGNQLKNLPSDLNKRLPMLKTIYDGLSSEVTKLGKEVAKQSGKAKEGAQKLLALAEAEKNKAWNEIEKGVKALCPPNKYGATCSQDSDCNCKYLKCTGWWSKRCRVRV
ncbi:hypothetical protein MAR_036400 [Mya arenaria]|uniref:Uncharacterized protein n=1 Tax=Mya arenaria TaxID=6604 RepID=A0ABY7FPT4_MYAAR|nr:uncharacterized protein LOC128212789 [Mya arenaria]WAR22731.1 hypothetical protein MAR_036400 [Mya arenaria]